MKDTFMTVLHGFELLKEATIPELSSQVRHYRHTKTGAELLSVENNDDNKSFGVAFQTPAPDDSGLPHILEHSVLAGSRKYPLKDPFFEMIKTSLASFINAMTFPDMTIYPVASTNIKDFYNLIDVYLDAVFYPLLTERTFQQEGWHYEPSEDSNGVIYKGIVFNEMKGYFSSPEIMMGDKSLALTLPDTPYGNNSGGDPAAIPTLTYANFKEYHATYYHPSNARFFFYGDDEPEQRLKLVNEFIAEFEHKDVQKEMPRQPRFSEPRNVVIPVDAGEATAEDNKALMTINWLLGDVTNTREMMALSLLNQILIGNPASPLTVALLESGLGEDLTGGGLNPFSREAVYSIGMKGILAEESEAIEELILQTLGELADDGIDADTIAAALNTAEFDMREKNTGRMPRGLDTFIGILPVWMHGGDPIEALAFESDLQAIKQAYAENLSYFESLIGKYLLQNNHRVTVTLAPDPTVKSQRDSDEQRRLDDYNATLSTSDRTFIAEEVAALKAHQERMDSPEVVAKLPTLKLSDLERNIKVLPNEVHHIGETPLLYHDLGTSGVVYLDLSFDLNSLPIEYVPYVSIFSKALTELGTNDTDFIAFQNRIGAQTGGIDAGEQATLTLDRTNTIIRLLIRAKAMVGQTPQLLDILTDVLLNINFDNRERLRQMVLEDKAQMEAYLGLAGHAHANTRLRSLFDVVGWFNEQNNGISQLFFLRDLALHLDDQWDNILYTLNTMRELIINRTTMLVNVTLDQQPFEGIQSQLVKFIENIPQRNVIPQTWDYALSPRYEGLAVTTQVNFVGKGANLFDLGYKANGSQYVILNQFNLTYMFNKIRLQGGAYGGTLSFNLISGVGTFLSWQDPTIVETLANYDAGAEYLRTLELSQEELDKSIIGAIGNVDAYLLPDAKGMAAMTNYLIGNTDDKRQQRRDEIFGTTMADFRVFAEVLAEVAKNGAVVVAGSPDKLAAANERLAIPMTITKVQ